MVLPLDNLPAPQRILLIKPSALGDVVTALPVLRGLRRTFPNAEIHWLVSTSCSAILESDPDLDQVVLFDRKGMAKWYRSASQFRTFRAFKKTLRDGNYDWVLDLQGLLRSSIFARMTRAKVRAGFADAREGAPLFYTHKIKTSAEHTCAKNIEFARMLGIDARDEDMTLTVRDDAASAAQTLLAERNIAPGYLVAVPPTRWETKKYPVEHWRAVLGELAQERDIVLLGSPAPEETSLCAAVAEGLGERVHNLAGQTTLPQLVATIATSAGVICCDSAAKFIAPAVGVNCVCVLGPTRVKRTGPFLRGSAVVSDVDCQGCLKKRCPKPHQDCMEAISPPAVLAAVRAMLETH
ncbi:MAG: glycosyltransferase family 9 protein [Phycisphaerales bacterium]|jgi:heptosyltransferase I|nr:glycosyltransferase family 9 protein [Phycisphaerales bacterium]MBT7171289.1 glycosyltransferase family 9 protein [Phycisphaerales bacterium]